MIWQHGIAGYSYPCIQDSFVEGEWTAGSQNKQQPTVSINMTGPIVSLCSLPADSSHYQVISAVWAVPFFNNMMHNLDVSVTQCELFVCVPEQRQCLPVSWWSLCADVRQPSLWLCSPATPHLCCCAICTSIPAHLCIQNNNTIVPFNTSTFRVH